MSVYIWLQYLTGEHSRSSTVFSTKKHSIEGIASHSSYGTFFGTTIGTFLQVLVENFLQPGSAGSSTMETEGTGAGVGGTETRPPSKTGPPRGGGTSRGGPAGATSTTSGGGATISLNASRTVGLPCRTLIIAALTLSSRLLVPALDIKLSVEGSTNIKFSVSLNELKCFRIS